MTVPVNLLHEETDRIAWKSLHVGAERGINCEHMQVTNVPQRHWEWQEDCWTDLQRLSWQAWPWKKAFDVANPSVVSWILTVTGVHGHSAAALLAEMQDVGCSACFEDGVRMLRGMMRDDNFGCSVTTKREIGMHGE